MVKNPIVEPNSGLFLRTASHNRLNISTFIGSVACLALWNKFKVNNTLVIEESDEHSFHL
jgi:hypothetical protein